MPVLPFIYAEEKDGFFIPEELLPSLLRAYRNVGAAAPLRTNARGLLKFQADPSEFAVFHFVRRRFWEFDEEFQAITGRDAPDDDALG